MSTLNIFRYREALTQPDVYGYVSARTHLPSVSPRLCASIARVAEDTFIVGCGYVGRRVAAAEQARGNRVNALARSEDSAPALRALGIEPVGGDLDDLDSLAGLDVAGQGVYYFAPPPASGVRDTCMTAFLAAFAPRSANASPLLTHSD